MIWKRICNEFFPAWVRVVSAAFSGERFLETSLVEEVVGCVGGRK